MIRVFRRMDDVPAERRMSCARLVWVLSWSTPGMNPDRAPLSTATPHFSRQVCCAPREESWFIGWQCIVLARLQKGCLYITKRLMLRWVRNILQVASTFMLTPPT
jgi:hypothetical protein